MYSDIDEIANCFTLIVGKNVSSTGHVLVGHNEDDPGYVHVNHGIVPAKDWDEGSIISCEEDTAKVSQVSHTNKFYWSECKNAKMGLASADAFYNEYGVFIVSNSCASSKADVNDESNVIDGGITYLIRRSLAERAKSAREGVQIVIDLMEKYGYSSSGRAYTIADKDEAFFMQLVRGHYYLGAKVPDDKIVIMPNHYILSRLDECEEMFYPKDLVSHAIDMGWYTPAKEGDYSDFDFCKAYQETESYMRDYNFLRSKFASKIVAEKEWEYSGESCPFAVDPKGKISPLDIFDVLTCHYEGSAYEKSFTGPGQSPHNTSTRRICTATTLESLIAVLGDTPEDGAIYTAYGRPCELPFLRLHPFKGLPKGAVDMDNPARSLEMHFVTDENVAKGIHGGDWFKFRSFQSLMEMFYKEYHDEVKEMWKDFLKRELEDEDQSAEKDEEFFSEALAEISKFKTAKLNNASILKVDELHFDSFEEKIKLIFMCPGKASLKRLILGLEDLGVTDYYGKAISLEMESEGVYTAEFDTTNIKKQIFGPGEYRIVLGGNIEITNKCFGALGTLIVR